MMFDDILVGIYAGPKSVGLNGMSSRLQVGIAAGKWHDSKSDKLMGMADDLR